MTFRKAKLSLRMVLITLLFANSWLAAAPSTPTANNQTVTTAFNTAKAITLTGSDPNHLSLTYSIVSNPTHGTLSGTAPNVTYTPTHNYTGSDSFTFRVSNGSQTSNTATVSITVSAPTTPPTANAQSVSVTFNTAKAITLTGSDPNSLPLTYTIVTNPTHGTLSGTGANKTYTPAANYSGADSFTFKVNNGFLDSSPATVTISVGTPAAPTANNQAVTIVFNTAKAITLTGTDPNSLPLTYIIVSNPAHGALSGSGANQTYTPATNYSGPDSFTFKVNNGTSDSNIATISLTVNAPSPPTANSQSVTTAFNTSTPISLTGSDPNSLPLTYIIVTNPAHGTLSGSGANRTYTPTTGYSGSDSFTFKVNNGVADSNIATVSISVNGPLAPTANNQAVTTGFNAAKAITLAGSDPIGLPLTYAIVTNPAHGGLSGSGANQTYTPTTNFSGADSFTFRVNNGFLDSAPATVSITVSLPGAPTANSQVVTVAFNVPKAIALTGTDPNNLTLTYSIVGSPTHGSLSGAAPNVTYTPTSNYSGPDSFTFKVNNGSQDSSAATVNLTVTSPAAPAANSQSVTVPFDTPQAITLTGTDPNNLPLNYTIVGNPTQGTLSGSAPNLTYTPNSGYSGADSFTFKVNNGSQNSNNATVSLTVSPSSTVTFLNPPTINVSGPVSLNDTITVTPAPCCFADYYVWTFIPVATASNSGSAASVVSVPHATTDLTLAGLGLQLGTYLVHVHGVTGQVTSEDAIATITIVSPSFFGARVYPNPWRTDKDADLMITFDQLTDGAIVKIFDMAGHWVRTLNAPAGSVPWDRRNDQGNEVASGMYIYLIDQPQTGRTRGKLTIIK